LKPLTTELMFWSGVKEWQAACMIGRTHAQSRYSMVDCY
jgi:hypothetical protein